MLLTGGSEAHVAFPVEPCFPILWVNLQDRLEFPAATIDAALYEGHGGSVGSELPDSESLDSSARLRHRGQYHGAGDLMGFGLRLRHRAQW